MYRCNYDAVLIIDEKAYFLEKQLLRELPERKDAPYDDGSQRNWPPEKLSLRILQKIEEKYGALLPKRKRDLLASMILKVEYRLFEFFMSVQIRSPELGKYSVSPHQAMDMERERLDWNARIGSEIPRDQFEKSYLRDLKKRKNKKF